MKNLGLDIGDVWVGSALSDPMGIICSPYKTVKLKELITFLKNLFSQEIIGVVVVGHPITVGGNVSAQTKKVEELFEKMRSQFPDFNGEWVLWDERFSTKRAKSTIQQRKKKKDDSTKEHSIAAAFILQSYLDHKAF